MAWLEVRVPCGARRCAAPLGDPPGGATHPRGRGLVLEPRLDGRVGEGEHRRRPEREATAAARGDTRLHSVGMQSDRRSRA